MMIKPSINCIATLVHIYHGCDRGAGVYKNKGHMVVPINLQWILSCTR